MRGRRIAPAIALIGLLGLIAPLSGCTKIDGAGASHAPLAGGSTRSSRTGEIGVATASGSAATGAAVDGAPKQRHPWTQPGHIRLGEPDEPDNLNPLFSHTAATDEVDSLIFAPVLRYDQNGNLIPELATEVPTPTNGGISRDGTTITLHFRKDAVWSDGAPLDARDFRFTWRAVMNDRNNVKSRIGWAEIRAIDLPDAHTAVIRLKRPDADVLGSLAIGGTGYPPLPEHLLGKLPDVNEAAFNTHPIASGPWLLKRWDHGASLEFAPNVRYWRGPPRAKAITWKVIPNSETLFAQLQTHEIDVYDGVAVTQIDRLGAIPGITVRKRLVANWRHLEFNTRRPQLADVRVRRAIAEAVDWDRINATVYRGINVRAVSDIMPTSWAAPRVPFYPHDPADAQRLLDAAGWRLGSDGIRHRGPLALRLAISSGTGNQPNEQAEVQMQQQLRAVGIAVDIKNYPVSLLFAQNGPLYSGNYDLSWSMSTNGPDPDNEGIWSARFIPPHGANTTFIDDPLITRTSAEAAHTFDRARRKALYQIEETRIHALVPAVFLYWQNAYAAYNSDLRNYKPAQYIANCWNSWEWEI